VKKRIRRQVMCFSLAIMLVVGMMPGITMTAHANTTITEIAVNDITVPEIGEAPDYTSSVPADAAYYIAQDLSGMTNDVNGISWVNNGNVPIKQDAVFAEDGNYDVRMEIYAKAGYVFDAKDNLNVTVNGQPARVISRTDTKIYIKYIFGAPIKKQTITSIELYHETDIEAKNGTKNLLVSKINGEPFDGEKYAGFQWYRSTSNFDDINEAGVTAWDDSKDGYKFVGGYAYGLRIENLPKIDGYKYGPSVVVALKMPSYSKTATLDANGNCYFYWDKLDYKPDLESVNLTMDGYYVGANVIDLTFSSSDPIKTDGGSSANVGRYTIRKYNANTQQYDVLSSSLFAAGEKYYLFFYLESDLDIKGLPTESVKVNGSAAFGKGVENGRTYYMFSLPTLTEQDVEKTVVSSIVLSMPKAKPAAGDAAYYPTVLSVNGDGNLAKAVDLGYSQWYQCDYHTDEAIYELMESDRFVQGKSYCFWLSLNLNEEYKLADDCTVTLQTPSGNLEGELKYKGTTSIEYEYYFNLGAPTELPELVSYVGTLSGYDAGLQIEETQLEIKLNGKKIPKNMIYGMAYAILDENQQFIEQGSIKYDTQYYCSMMVGAYNCKPDGFTADKIKKVATLNGIKPESVTGQGNIWLATFKLPILKKGAACNGTDHDYKQVLVPATTEYDGKSYEICTKGCDTVRNEIIIPRIKSVKLSTVNYTYNGSAKKPSVTVTNSKGKVLKNGTDYTVSYASGRTKIGKYKVTVTFKGNYSGSKNLYFEIGPKNPSSVKTTLYGYDDVKVTWSKVSGVSGYKVYCKKSTASSYTLLKTTTATSYKKANLSDGVKYDFKVVAYKKVNGNACENAGKTSSLYTLKKVAGVKAAKSGSKVKVSWTNINGETGYQISQATSKSKTKVVVTYKTASGKYKNVSAKKGKTYYYKVRAYKVVDGKKIYGPWSSVVKYKR